MRERLDEIDRKLDEGKSSARQVARNSIVSGLLAAVIGAGAALTGAIVGANQAEETARAQLVAERRVDAFGSLGFTARDQLRDLEKHRDALVRGRPPAGSLDDLLEAAYPSVRNAAVVAELVGTTTAAAMSRCLTRGFLQSNIQFRAFSGNPSLENRRRLSDTLDALSEYANDFIDYAAEHLYDAVRDPDAPAPEVPSDCRWKAEQ